MRSKFLTSTIAVLLTSALLPGCPTLSALALSAAPPSGSATATQKVAVRIAQTSPSVSTTGTFETDVITELAASAEYFEVRLRITSGTGHVLYQKTEVRHNVRAGELTVRYSRSLSGLGVQPGQYQLEVRVLATGASATEITGAMLVTPRDYTPVPVALIVRFTYSPAIDSSGRFVVNPETDIHPRTDVVRLADLIAQNPGLRLSLAIAPELLEEWVRASDGYQTSGPEGVRDVAETAPGSVASQAALGRLRELAASDRVEVLDVPYADPDVVALARLDAIADLNAQWRLGDSIRKTAIGSTASSGTAFLGDVLLPSTLPALTERKLGYAVLARSSVRSGKATATAGVYTLDESDVRGVVYDSRLTTAARIGNLDAFYRSIFSRLDSETPAEPMAVLVEVGPGTLDSIASLERVIGLLQSTPWVRIVTAQEAAAYPVPRPGTLNTSPAVATAPAGYWDDVSLARTNALAAVAALGRDDADARTANRAVYVAESRSWAGPDGSYALSDRGRAFATSASRYVEELFSSVTIEAQDVTLSNRTGKVPVSVINGTGKDMKVRLTAVGEVLGPIGNGADVRLDPGENVLTVPVNMGSTLSDRLTVTLSSGGAVIKAADVLVTASYLDRLATLGMAIIIMLGLLLVIRRRVRAGSAGTMQSEPTNPDAAI